MDKGNLLTIAGFILTTCLSAQVSDSTNWSGNPDLVYAVRYDVELVPQSTGVSCWAAATAMIVGWRDFAVLNPEDIAEGTGYWAQYNHERYSISRTLDPEDLNMFEIWGLVPDTRRTFNLDDIGELLWRYGPLWVATLENLNDRGRLDPHIRVITGIEGDGSAQGTLLYINDPWDRNRQRFRSPNFGSQYTETFQEFIQKMTSLQDMEQNVDAIYLAYP